MRLTVTFKENNFDKALKAIQQETGALLYQSANKIMTASKKIAPVDTGNLRASGFVEQPKIKGDTVTVTMGYGGAAVDYAVYVHEGTHNMQGRKYLEQPFNQLAPQEIANIKRKLGI